MSSLNNQPSIEQAIAKLRDDIVLSHSKSQELSLTGFDRLVQQLQQFAIRIQRGDEEIKRLQEVCTKNKIEFKAPETKPVKTESIPQEPKKLLPNKP